MNTIDYQLCNMPTCTLDLKFAVKKIMLAVKLTRPLICSAVVQVYIKLLFLPIFFKLLLNHSSTVSSEFVQHALILTTFMNYNNAMFYFPVCWPMQDYQAFDDALEADELEKFLKLN